MHSTEGLEHDLVCRGEAGGDSDTWQRGAARSGLQDIPRRPTLLQVPCLCPVCCTTLLATAS